MDEEVNGMTDREIIEYFTSRNEEAIRAMADVYGSRLLRTAENFLCREDAEECVNDLYLALWKHIPPEKPAHLYAYAVRILRNLAFNRLRAQDAAKRNAEVVALTDELAAVLEDDSRNTEEEAIARTDDRIARFLSCIDEEERYIFVHRYFFGECISELQKTTGFSKSKIEVTLFRLRKKLKAFLEKEKGD